MTWKDVNNADAGDATHFGGDDFDKVADLFNGVATVDTVNIDSLWTFRSGRAYFRNPANTFSYQLVSAAIAADRILNLPLCVGTDTLASLGVAQTFTGINTFANNVLKIRNPADTFSYLIQAAAIAADRTLNLPLTTATDTLACLGLAQSFSAVITHAVGTKYPDGVAIIDDNNNEILKILKTASAVNEFTMKNAATGGTVDLQLTGGDTNINGKVTPKGTGVFFGTRETFAYPLTDETTLPTTGVKYVTEPFPYDFTITDVIAGLTTAGTGASLFTVDVLLEDTAPNTNTFTTIFSTKPTIDASEFTSTTAATAKVLSATAIAKGKRLQLKIHQMDSNNLARGCKIAIVGYATAV